MIQCPKCGLDTTEGASACINCNHLFLSNAPQQTGAAASHANMIDRPNGEGFIIGGIVTIILGVIAGFIYLKMAGGLDGSLPQTDSPLTNQIVTLSGGLLSLGFTLFIAGHIIRALWFLPGDAKKRR